MGPPWHAIRRGVRLVWIVWTAIMLWGIAKPEKMMDFQAQAFRPSEDHGFKLVPDAPIVVLHLDTSSYSASQKQCVFQYGEFYGSFSLGMLCMMAFARSPATEAAGCVHHLLHLHGVREQRDVVPAGQLLRGEPLLCLLRSLARGHLSSPCFCCPKSDGGSEAVGQATA